MKSLCICLACLLALVSFAPAEAEDFYFDFSDMGDGFEDISSVPTRDVSLCYVSADASDFSFATRSFDAPDTYSLITAVLSELTVRTEIAEGLGGFRVSAVPDFELSGSSVTVDLPIDAIGSRTSWELLLASTALANSLLSIEELDTVSILFGGRACFIMSLPMGAFTETVENAALAYANIESEHSSSANTGAPVVRSALIYYPSVDGSRVIPVPASVTASSDTWIMALIRALGVQPADDRAYVAAIPDTIDLLVSEPSVTVNESGERVIDVNFKSVLPDYLALSGTDPALFYASLTLTLTSFVPDIAGVRVYTDGAEVTSASLPSGGTVTATKQGFERASFSPLIGSVNTIYLKNPSGRLTPVSCVTGTRETLDPPAVLRELFTTGASGGLVSCIPEGVDDTDILSVEHSDRQLSIDLSANFYTRSQSLDKAGERLLIYSIVNTLCGLPGVKAVSFTFEGRPVDLFVHDICLSSALMPDPGLIDP